MSEIDSTTLELARIQGQLDGRLSGVEADVKELHHHNKELKVWLEAKFASREAQNDSRFKNLENKIDTLIDQKQNRDAFIKGAKWVVAAVLAGGIWLVSWVIEHWSSLLAFLKVSKNGH